MLTTGCAPSTEAKDQARQHIQDGTTDDDTIVRNGVVELACTGTLISAEWVLTAAHCVNMASEWPSARDRIHIGLSKTVTPGGRTIERVADQCFMHPSAYAASGMATPWRCGVLTGTEPWVNVPFDVALIHLGTPVPRTVARPVPVYLTNPLASLSAWTNQWVHLAGWGEAGAAGGPTPYPDLRQHGFNQIDSLLSGTFDWSIDRTTTTGAMGAIGLPGDSGGALLFGGGSLPREAVMGLNSGMSRPASPNTATRAWGPTTFQPSVAAWINSVMINGTDASAQVTSGTVPSPPAAAWLGEGTDLNGRVSPSGATLSGDNCPSVFNPWQDDTDGDGMGNECDRCPGGPSRATIFDHDEDGDGISAECGDNCPTIANPTQEDADSDGWGDACDLCVNVFDPPRLRTNDQQSNCNRDTEIELSRPALGDRCDPYPCNPTDNLNTGFDRIDVCDPTMDPTEDHCVRGSSFVQVGYAPRVGSGATVPWTPTSTADPLTSPLWRCVCIREGTGTQQNDPAACFDAVEGACPRDAEYRNVVTGHGWHHAAVVAPGWATLGEGLGQVWGAPTGALAPRLNYITHPSRSAAAAWWRLEAGNAALSGITFWNWNWAASTELYPTEMPRAQPFVPFTNPPRVAFWTRAQPLTDPGNNPTSTPYRVARMQDSYTSDVVPLEEPHVIVVSRQRASIFWNINLRAPPLPIGPFPCPESLAELVTRFRPRVIPLTAQSPSGASDMFFPNGSTNDPTRGIVVALVDVRQGTISYTAATGALAQADLPVQSNLSFALGKMDAQGFPEVYAFGGRNADTSLTRDLYYTTHGYLTNGRVEYKWHRVAGPSDLTARENSALVASADGQRVYVVGGRNGANVFSDVWRYDLADATWRPLELSATMPARYDATAVAMNDRLFVGGGITTGGTYLGDLIEIDGLTGGVMNYGNVLPVGALPDLTFDQHYEGLLYAGGYVGSTWYRDLWTVDILGSSVTTTFVHDFGGDGLAATSHYSLVGDIAHNAFWAVPGYQSSGGAGQKVWFLQDGVASSSGGAALRAAGSGAGGSTSSPTTSSPARRTNPRGAPRATQVRPNGLTQGIR